MSSKLAPRPFCTLGVKPFLWASSDDLAQLHREFLKLSRKHHPDLLLHASPETRALQEAASSQLNTDYSKLRDFWKLCESVVHGVQVPQKGGGKTSTPPELAEAYFELQELLFEDPELAKKEMPNFLIKVERELSQATAAVETFARRFPFAGFGDSGSPWSDEDLEELNNRLQKLRYFRSFRSDIEKKFKL